MFIGSFFKLNVEMLALKRFRMEDEAKFYHWRSALDNEVVKEPVHYQFQ